METPVFGSAKSLTTFTTSTRTSIPVIYRLFVDAEFHYVSVVSSIYESFLDFDF